MVKVFISYSWEPDSHMDLVLDLANKLRLNGIDCWIDQFEQNPDEGWPIWMLNKIDWADHVLLVCSEPYYLAFRRRQDPQDPRGRGAAWETSYIIQNIYDSRGQTAKFIPISFTPEDERYIPDVVRTTSSHFRLLVKDGHVMKDGYESLWGYLANRHPVVPEGLGELTLSPQERTKDFIDERSRQMTIVKVLADFSTGCRNPDRRGNVIFIHGIAGDAYSTWQPQGSNSNGFWLQWLGEEMPGVGIWSLAYNVRSIGWKELVAPLAPITGRLLKELARQSFGKYPLIFVGYDLGGFIVRDILQKSLKSTILEQKSIWEQTQGVAFLSTPCSIQDRSMTNWIEFLGESLKELDIDLNFHQKQNLSNSFAQLNTDFWENCREKRELKVIPFYASSDTKRIVDFKATSLELQETVSDRRTFFEEPVSVENSDHFSICRLQSKNEEVYREVKYFIQRQFSTRAVNSGGHCFRIQKSEGNPSDYDLRQSPACVGYDAKDPNHNIDDPAVVKAWKVVHYLSEILYTAFLQFGDEVIRWGEAIDVEQDEEVSIHEKVRDYINKKKKESTEAAWKRMNETVLYEVQDKLLPELRSPSLDSISQSEYVIFLSNFSNCCNATKEVIGLDYEKTYELTKSLKNWLCGSLHTADQILKEAFNQGILRSI
jgi:hypothetical protein